MIINFQRPPPPPQKKTPWKSSVELLLKRQRLTTMKSALRFKGQVPNLPLSVTQKEGGNVIGCLQEDRYCY